MKKMTILFGIWLITGSFANAHAAGFIKFNGIDGDSVVEGYVNWSEFLSVVQEITSPEITTGVVTRLRGNPEFKEITVVKTLDKASPKIADRALRDWNSDEVKVEWTRNIAGIEQPYYAYEMKNVLVTQYSSKGFGDTDLDSAKDNQIVEKIVLNFEDIKVTYYEYDDAGNLAGTVEYEWSN